MEVSALNPLPCRAGRNNEQEMHAVNMFRRVPCTGRRGVFSGAGCKDSGLPGGRFRRSAEC